VVVFAPAGALGQRADQDYSQLRPEPLGVGTVRRPGDDVTVVAVGHLVGEALQVAEQLSGRASIEVFDPRTLHPFDWDGLLGSVRRTRRLVVIDDSNRSCGIGAEIVTSVVEQVRLLAPPRRVSRPDGAVLAFAHDLDLAVQPSRDLLVTAIDEVLEEQ
jgi:pyruvate dehydrogenase E1 component beta subunit